MKMYLMLVAAMTLMVGCSEDKLKVIHNNDRVSLLEARADLNAANDSLLEMRVSDLERRMHDVEVLASGVQADLATYKVATDAAIDSLRDKDADLAYDIANLFGDLSLLQGRTSLLETDLSALKTRVNTLETRLQGVEGSFPTLAARLNSMKNSISLLQTNVGVLQFASLLQGVQLAWLQSEINRLDGRINTTNTNLGTLTQEVQDLTSLVTTINNTYATNAQIDNLQGQLDNIQLTPGKSAYQIWLDLGNSGNEQAFITSLKGAQGPQGIPGQDGQQGQQGVPGTPGQDGASVQMVQLCPGDSGTYKEQGIKVGNDLYAVYYGTIGGTLQAFLAKLAPGNYVTTNGASCQFTVTSTGTTTSVSSPPSPLLQYDLTGAFKIKLCGTEYIALIPSKGANNYFTNQNNDKLGKLLSLDGATVAAFTNPNVMTINSCSITVNPGNGNNGNNGTQYSAGGCNYNTQNGQGGNSSCTIVSY